VTEGDCKEEILRNASKVEEDYFVAPPGNIPLDIDGDKYHRREEDGPESAEERRQ